MSKLKVVSKNKGKKKKNLAKIQNANSEKVAKKLERLQLVGKACEELVEDGLVVNYTLVAEKTKIPKRTLERSYYKELIARYRTEPEVEEKVSSQDAESWKREAEYWREVATKWQNAVKKLVLMLAQRGIVAHKTDYMPNDH